MGTSLQDFDLPSNMDIDIAFCWRIWESFLWSLYREANLTNTRQKVLTRPGDKHCRQYKCGSRGSVYDGNVLMSIFAVLVGGKWYNTKLLASDQKEHKNRYLFPAGCSCKTKTLQILWLMLQNIQSSGSGSMRHILILVIEKTSVWSVLQDVEMFLSPRLLHDKGKSVFAGPRADQTMLFILEQGIIFCFFQGSLHSVGKCC